MQTYKQVYTKSLTKNKRKVLVSIFDVDLYN